MRKSAFHWVLVAVAPLAIFAACSSDDSVNPSGSAGSKAGNGGTAGSGGAPAGTAGNGGSATGGKAGSGGSATGGSAGAAGKAGSGGGATGGSAGTAGTGGSPISDSGTDAKPADGGSDASPTACVANTGTNPLISNMEGAKPVVSATDGRTANDIGNLNPTYAPTFEQVLESDGGTNHVLHVKGAIPGTGFLSHETGLNLTTSSLPLCYDASAYAGVSLKIRGSSDNAAPNGLGANMARVYLLTKSTRPSTATPPGTCTPPDGGAGCGYPYKDIALTGTLTKVDIKWTDFAIASFLFDPGVPKADYGKTVFAVQIDVFGAGGNPLPDGAVAPTVNFEYWLDDVAFLPQSD